MKIKSVEGIVISETNYSESSKILNVLTKDFGIVGVVSKGCRKLKSKLRSVSSRLVYGDFHIYYKEKGLSTLISVDVINSFRNIMTDIEKISYAGFLLELTHQVYKQNDDKDIYSLFISSLNKIEEGFNPVVLTNIIELKYLDYLGINLSIDGCSICGTTDDIVTISVRDNGYLCKNCHTNQEIVSDKAVKLLRMFHYVDISKITKLEVSYDSIREINKFLDEYYDEYTGLYLKSKQFLKNLNKITQNT